ncbi:pfs-domain-containing protein [Aspergillus terreus]|uniref:Pfs-domain-containing protein n=1 Tax=Aspergillus terreus TaxID=33178 RepID=A0A5M3YVM4_ASPTE|nr:hypothetical protein ATETN484_0004016700 [Aspergillus terreus]GFF13057.1 pfs-domain-containing protein [Aspergillus terreus]
MAGNIWRHSCARLEDELRGHGMLSDDVNDFETFQACMERACKEYARSQRTHFIRDKITPHLQHVQSFEKAITVSSQLSTPSAIIWSITWVVIESASRFATHLSKILDALERFYQRLPRFDQYLELFPNSKRLQIPLSDLFVDYGYLCIHALKWIKRNPIVHMIKGVVSSRPSNNLDEIMRRMERHIEDFKENVELAFRQHQMGHSVSTRSGHSNSFIQKSHYLIMERRDAGFKGRKDVLKEIHLFFNSPKTSPSAEAKSYLLHGLSGIGKTSTALEYTYIHQKSYDFIFWIFAETTSDLVGSFTRVVTRLRSLHEITCSGTSDAADESGINDARDWFETTAHKWLLVFDNVEEWESISQYWPTSAVANSAILVTSQKQQFKRWTGFNRQLEDLSMAEATEILLAEVGTRGYPHEREAEAAQKIVETFGGLPLAIAHIAGYVSDAQCSLHSFVELTKQRYATIWDCNVPVSTNKNNKRLSALWDFALDELPPDARRLLYTMSFLSPDAIPESMFLPNESQDSLGYIAKKADFIEKIRFLVRRALIRPVAEIQGFNTYGMHRALQRALLYKLDKQPDLRSQIFSEACSIVRDITPSASPIQVPNPSLWLKFERAVPQILALRVAFEQSQPSMQGSIEFARLLYDAAFNTWERESSQDGLSLLTTAMNVLDDSGYDKDGKLRADILVMQGVICDNIGISRRQEALQVRKIATHIRQMVIRNSSGPVNETDDILLHNALNDTAESLLQYYNFREADRLIEQCLERYKTWGSEEKYPFEYGKYYRNKAAVLTLQRRFDEAITHAKRSVELARLDTGIGPRYLLYLQDVASHLLQSGNLQGAIEQHLEVFQLREELCGKYHDVTLQSAYAVGAMYFHVGNMEKAEAWFELTLDRAKRTRWPEEPLCRAKFHLARNEVHVRL